MTNESREAAAKRIAARLAAGTDPLTAALELHEQGCLLADAMFIMCTAMNSSPQEFVDLLSGSELWRADVERMKATTEEFRRVWESQEAADEGSR